MDFRDCLTIQEQRRTAVFVDQLVENVGGFLRLARTLEITVK